MLPLCRYILCWYMFLCMWKGENMSEGSQENYISLEEAAAYLDVKPATIRSWIKNPDNEIPAHKVGRMWKFKRSEIDEWINSGKSAKIKV